MDDLNLQNFANTAWAFATAGQKDASLFVALATAAERRMDDFNPQNLVNTAWGSLTVGIQTPDSMKKLGAATPQVIE